MAELRTTFAEDAELYDRSRPGYPPEMFIYLNLRQGTRVLEIGPGTGQATLPLAQRGCVVTAVELGESLAAVARRKVAGFPVDVQVGAFEDWPVTRDYDLVFAATSFHWIDPKVRMVKSAAALKPGGRLAVVSTHHIAGGTSQFFADMQFYYEKYDPTTPPGLVLEPASAIPCEFDESPLFKEPTFSRYEWEVTYTAQEYLDVLYTYSGHRALSEQARDGLFTSLRRLIDENHGGHVTKRYMTQLAVAHVR
jgi:SAM-dependent methyltransferase